jgi:predicted phosphodiesterase
MTRLAVLSDIHGNCVALDAVLADLEDQAIDGTICLGDAIQGGPQPAQVAQRLRELDCPVVMGNSDAWLLSGIETDAERISPERRAKLNTVREWSLTQLSSDDREFIATFEPTVLLPLEAGRSLLAYHGSPDSFDEIILPDMPEKEFRRILGAHAANILAGGHVHLQFLRRIADSFHFNPGSVGVAYSHEQPDDRFRLDPWAEYAILTVDGARLGLEFRRIPFDVDELVRVTRGSGRPFADQTAEEYGRT